MCLQYLFFLNKTMTKNIFIQFNTEDVSGNIPFFERSLKKNFKMSHQFSISKYLLSFEIFSNTYCSLSDYVSQTL